MCVCLREGERDSVKSEQARLQAACALNRPGSRNMPEGPRRATREKITHAHTLSLVKGQCFSQREPPLCTEIQQPPQIYNLQNSIFTLTCNTESICCQVRVVL